MIKKIYESIDCFITIIFNFIKRLGMIFFISLGIEIYTIYRFVNNFDTVHVIFLVLLTSYMMELLQIRFIRKEEE